MPVTRASWFYGETIPTTFALLLCWLTASILASTIVWHRGADYVFATDTSTPRPHVGPLCRPGGMHTPRVGRAVCRYLVLLAVTAEDEAGEPVCARLIATTTDPMTEAFQQLWRSYADRGVLTLFTHSKYSASQPYVVAHATW